MCWVVIVVGLLRVREGAFGGAAERPEGQLRGHRPLVFDRSADVADRVGSARRRLRRPRGTGHPTGRCRARTASASVAANGVSATPVRPIPARLMWPASSSHDDGGDTDGGEVADLALELLVRAAGRARPADHADLGQDLGRLDGGLERVEEEVAGRDLALAGLAATDDRGVARDERRRPIRGRVGVGDRAADRAPVADLRVADRRRSRRGGAGIARG